MNNVSKKKSLASEDRRTLYSSLLKAVSLDPTGGQSFMNSMKPPASISVDPQKFSFWNRVVSELINGIAQRGKGAIWENYEQLVGEDKGKVLGQYFTPLRVASFAISGIEGYPETILDPMAGHGSFLLEATKRFPLAKTLGVEIDSLPLSAARLMLDEKTVLIQDDFFRWSLSQVQTNPAISFSAIVGNPAYVSYQNLDRLRSLAGADTGKDDYRSFLLRTIRRISLLKGFHPTIGFLFDNWSGLNDLATYSLILSWLMTSENGQICFVMSNHWMEREYGRLLREFLVTHGTVRVILTHRGGKWFPRAQIPTSVIVYTKGTVSSKQREIGVPYAEIQGPPVEDLRGYLEKQIGSDFWGWIDSCTTPGQYGQIRVTFRDWSNRNDLARYEHGTPRNTHSLRLPVELEKVDLVSLEDLGWEVHQGLRTGCNEVFYVKFDSESDEYIASMVSEGKRSTVSLRIPESYLLPALQKIRQNASLTFSRESTDIYLLNLNGSALVNDVESLRQYPRSWLESWIIDEIRRIPEPVASYLRNSAERLYDGKGSTRKRVIDLAAVRTNIYRPRSRSGGGVPRPPRFWYQVPLHKRHFGEIAIPRVSSGPIRAILVLSPGTIVVDANFLTYVSSERSLTAESLWVWLNSNSFRRICESNAVPLGGGALKLEAELLSRIPVPKTLNEQNDIAISKALRRLREPLISDETLLDIGVEIDSILFGHSIAMQNKDHLRRVIKQRQKPS